MAVVLHPGGVHTRTVNKYSRFDYGGKKKKEAFLCALSSTDWSWTSDREAVRVKHI